MTEGTPQNPIVVELATPKSSALAVARAIIEPVLGPLETTVIVMIVAIFVLMQREDLRDRFIRLVGATDLHRTTTAMDDAGKRLSRYFVSQLGVNACFGLVIGVGFWVIGVPSPALWGVLAGLLRFVPYVGPMLAAVAPLALAAAIDPGWRATIYVALLFVHRSNRSRDTSSNRFSMATRPDCRRCPSSSRPFSGRGCGGRLGSSSRRL